MCFDVGTDVEKLTCQSEVGGGGGGGGGGGEGGRESVLVHAVQKMNG